MEKLLWLAGAGALGTLARAGLSGLVQRIAGATFPAGTMFVNVLGCFLFGAIWAYTESRTHLPPTVRLAVLTGFMGAFTTFSTYIFDTGDMLQAARWGSALVHLGAQNVVGIACLFGGLALGRAL